MQGNEVSQRDDDVTFSVCRILIINAICKMICYIDDLFFATTLVHH